MIASMVERAMRKFHEIAPAMLVLATLLVTSLSCQVRVKTVHNEDQKKAALAALALFHNRLSAGDFDAIYETFGDALRAQPKADILASMKATHDRWGKLINAEVKASSCFPNEVRLLVQAQFAKGEAGEMIVWQVSDERVLLQHFQIFPGAVKVSPGASNECR
jgi:hypothetical protein